jgi:hypothetical protein
MLGVFILELRFLRLADELGPAHGWLVSFLPGETLDKLAVTPVLFPSIGIFRYCHPPVLLPEPPHALIFRPIIQGQLARPVRLTVVHKAFVTPLVIWSIRLTLKRDDGLA